MRSRRSSWSWARFVAYECVVDSWGLFSQDAGADRQSYAPSFRCRAFVGCQRRLGYHRVSSDVRPGVGVPTLPSRRHHHYRGSFYGRRQKDHRSHVDHGIYMDGPPPNFDPAILDRFNVVLPPCPSDTANPDFFGWWLRPPNKPPPRTNEVTPLEVF